MVGIGDRGDDEDEDDDAVVNAVFAFLLDPVETFSGGYVHGSCRRAQAPHLGGASSHLTRRRLHVSHPARDFLWNRFTAIRTDSRHSHIRFPPIGRCDFVCKLP